MTQLETLSSVQGRALLREIYRELRFERQLSAMATLRTCWQICTTERELFRLTRRNVIVLHPLGVLSGTALWMQEIVSRHAYSTISSFVYFGAALLLVIVGLNRTRVLEDPAFLVAGVVLEALLLMLLFLVMFFTPPDEGETSTLDASATSASDELLRELGEIGRDYAAMGVQLETIAATLTDLVERQDLMLSAVRDGVNAAVSAVAPNPDLMAAMKKTTHGLEQFSSSVGTLGERLQALERREVEHLVREELEKILSRNILDRNERPSS